MYLARNMFERVVLRGSGRGTLSLYSEESNDSWLYTIRHIFCHVGVYLLLGKACVARNVIYGTCSLAGAGYST